MPSASTTLTFNELDGLEIKELLRKRWVQIIDAVPQFQHHITFPKVRVSLVAEVEIWADQAQPEILPLTERLEVIVESKVKAPTETFRIESEDSTAPIPGGHPPDELRDMHGLPVTQPVRGNREIGGQVAVADQLMPLEGREVDGMPGLKISRTGTGTIDGMASSENATLAKIDQGPAGLRKGQLNRDQWHFGGAKR